MVDMLQAKSKEVSALDAVGAAGQKTILLQLAVEQKIRIPEL